MDQSVALLQSAYDRIADGYDALWSAHLEEPQRRLTEGLSLAHGMRGADLGCGTGIDAVDMAKRIAPGEMIAVDCSARMLEAAQRRARSAGLVLTTRCESAQDFLQHAALATPLDFLSLRFCLAYLDWRTLMPEFTRPLRVGGRVAILTNLSTSTPQAYAAYRAMVPEFALPSLPPGVPDNVDQMAERLERGGASIEDSWTHRFRLSFASGEHVVTWLRESGFITHPALSSAPQMLIRALWRSFAKRIEAQRERDGVPLDFEIAGVIARKMR